MKFKTVLTKAKIVLKDNRVILSILMAWFVLGACVFFFAFHMSLLDAIKASVFFKQVDGNFANAYNMWTQALIFGVAITLLFQNMLEKYVPERSCRMLAKELSDHVVIVGYSHLGRRLVAHFRDMGVPYCIIEKNRDSVDDLLREGEPVVLDDAKEQDALQDANVAAARIVLVVSNNLETALLVTKRVRECNKTCKIVTRCYQDEFAEIIESLGADEVISSSKNAFDDIVARMGP